MTVLQIDSLTAGYSDRIILSDVSVAVQRDDTLLVVGPNGSGKSTLFKALHGSARTFGGRASFMGEPMLLPVDDNSQRRLISFVPQHQNVFSSLTVAENLQLAGKFLGSGAKPVDAMMETALEILGAFRVELSLSAAQLSGGQKQCLAIALGIVRSPTLLMLDEPLAGLDPVAVERILDLIGLVKTRLGLSVVVIEHRYTHILSVATAIVGIRSGHKLLDIQNAQCVGIKEKNEAIEKLYFGDGD